MSRPEHQAPPEIVRRLSDKRKEMSANCIQYYGDTEAQKYTSK